MLGPVLDVRNMQVNKLQLEAKSSWRENKNREMTGLYLSLETEKWLGAGGVQWRDTW